MKRPPALRVIFDRSAFHGERFAALAACPLMRLLANKRLVIALTPILLEETLRSYGSSRATEWRAHLAFALDTCNGGIFLGKEEIWHNELVSGDGPFARYLRPERPSRKYGVSRLQLVEKFRNVVATGDLAGEWKESAGDREVVEQKKDRQRAIAVEIRKDVASHLKAHPGTRPEPGFALEQIPKSEFTTARRRLMDLIDPKRAISVADQWERAPNRFPFSTAFVNGLVFHAYHAAFEQSKPIDRNAQADYEQLAYLTWADVIVSNDDKFFRDAFDVIWRPRGKRLESAESFAELLQHLG